MSMNRRERLLTVLRGGMADRIPWNCYAWLVPQNEASRRLQEKGLSLMGTRRIFREVVSGASIREETTLEGGETIYHTVIETPVGTLTQRAIREKGYGSLWIREYFIKGVQDYPAVEYLFRHTLCEPDYAPWIEADREMGEAGIVVGEIMPVPIMTLMVNWMGVEGLAEGIYEHTAEFEALLDALTGLYMQQMQIAAESPAEIIWFGDNVTGTIISPRLFERYLAPTYARALEVLRPAGKIPIAHYDGSNRPLVKCLARTALPVIEAFTPPPGGDLSVVEAKAAWPDKVVWVNFPAGMFLEEEEVIFNYTLGLLEESAPGGRLVMGCTEDFPFEHFEKTFTAIGRALATYEGREW
ncbi:uroporphyrinogen decarboxylase [Anaerolinea thermolimosa]|uniref:Uroporphyrinogen decarboxylase n=2 Tax=Anaerolinea thermolimosa TaxID=229919 RepID=A0A7U9PUE6_9CHLR|nr:uroporphyrinogen decarboxylase [Anaerolinea thermolimosa]